MKGQNSILFDIDSIIDFEISAINYLLSKYTDNKAFGFDFKKVRKLTKEQLQILRMEGTTDLFKYIIKDKYADYYKDLLKSLYDEFGQNIIENYAYPTDLRTLIKGYEIAGNGVIQTSIRCDNEYQKKLVSQFFKKSSIFISERKDTDLEGYSRIIVGDYKNLYEYEYPEKPMSILVLNYRSNFMEENMSMLQPELVVGFGDVHRIEVIKAYNINEDKDRKEN